MAQARIPNEPAYNEPVYNEPSIGELFSRLSTQTSQLVRQEVKLAQAELSRKATKATVDSTYIAIGAVFGLGAFYSLTAALILILAEFMPGWLAALLVGIVWAVIAGILVWYGWDKLKNIDPKPERTMETLRENKEWLTRQI